MVKLSRLFKHELRDHQELRLKVPAPEGFGLVQRTVAELGWDTMQSSSETLRMEVLEDITRLAIQSAPLRLLISVRSDGNGRCIVNAEGIVPGGGKRAAKHLHDAYHGFVLTLARRAKAESLSAKP